MACTRLGSSHSDSRNLPYVQTFGEVEPGMPVLYSDSLQMVGLAVNVGDFSNEFGIGAGPQWRIQISRPQ
jgi:S-adenosylmethionine hydrolase